MVPNKYELQEAINIVHQALALGLAESVRRNQHPESWACDNQIDEFQVVSGACKGVIIPDMDFVIKYDYVKNPYCAREYENYQRAVEAGLERYFPYTAHLCCVDGIDFYIQERAVCGDDCDFSDLAVDSLKRYYDSLGESYDDDKIYDDIESMQDDAADMIRIVFQDEDLVNFVLANHINDLHFGNYGSIYGRYVIIDFSGSGIGIWG